MMYEELSVEFTAAEVGDQMDARRVRPKFTTLCRDPAVSLAIGASLRSTKGG